MPALSPFYHEQGEELMRRIKWYENRDIRSGEIYWWTQRDENGNCFEIRHLPVSGRYRLFINGCKKSDYGTLSEAAGGKYCLEQIMYS